MNGLPSTPSPIPPCSLAAKEGRHERSSHRLARGGSRCGDSRRRSPGARTGGSAQGPALRGWGCRAHLVTPPSTTAPATAPLQTRSHRPTAGGGAASWGACCSRRRGRHSRGGRRPCVGKGSGGAGPPRSSCRVPPHAARSIPRHPGSVAAGSTGRALPGPPGRRHDDRAARDRQRRAATPARRQRRW